MKEWETPRETGNENMKTLVFSVATKETFHQTHVQNLSPLTVGECIFLIQI